MIELCEDWNAMKTFENDKWSIKAMVVKYFEIWEGWLNK